MRKIICYRRGCNNQAVYEIPGLPILHLCQACLRKYNPTAVVYKSESLPQPQIGPEEFKEDLNGQEDTGTF